MVPMTNNVNRGTVGIHRLDMVLRGMNEKTFGANKALFHSRNVYNVLTTEKEDREFAHCTSSQENVCGFEH